MKAENHSSVVVIGLGNGMLADEGVGGHIVREVKRRVPAGVEVIDAGLPGGGLPSLLEGKQKAIIVDAVDGGGPPGRVYCFSPDQVTSAESDACVSLHGGRLLFFLKLAGLLGMCPGGIVIVGIQPENISIGATLSPRVQMAVPKAVERVMAEIHSEHRIHGAVRETRKVEKAAVVSGHTTERRK